MKKYLIFLILNILSLNSAYPQKYFTRQMEKLDRGIVAVRTSPDEVYVSWRLLRTDPAKTGFNLYRNSQKLNNKPITITTTFTDKCSSDETYSVRAVIKGKEQKEINSCSVWKQNYLKIQLNRPKGGIVRGDVPMPDRFPGGRSGW